METQGVWGVTNTELERAVAAVDPSALMLPARIVRRVLREDCNLGESGLKIPHRKTYFIHRDALAAIVAPSEIGYARFDELPETVILLARPEPEQLAAMTRPSVLLKYWRLLFHARVHVELERLVADGRLDETAVTARIAELGPLVFDEIRGVLKQENLLLPPATDVSTFIEFAAVYWELKFFAPRLLSDYFPSLPQADVVERVLGGEFDAARWFAACRLPGSPEPSEQTVEDEEALIGRRADPAATNPRKQSDRLYCRLMLLADRAQQNGNDVRAAVMRWWAALRIGPKLAKAARDAGREDVRRLSFRLGRALDADDGQRAAWTNLLEELLPQATRGLWPHERRFLYDLQKVCVDHEHGVFQLDVMSWLRSRGAKPIKRELPNQREVLIVKHLREALRRLSSLRVATPSRDRLAGLLRSAADCVEQRLRERLRPRIVEALDDVGLLPTNRAETIARQKLAEELLDRTVDRGFLNMGDLRDAVSRNNLKLRDIVEWRELWTGDEALRADRELAERLDGVYRQGEVYRRIPQWLSSAAFGTSYGRRLTKYVAVPFGGAYMILAFLHEIVRLLPEGAEPRIEPINRWTVSLLGGFIIMLYSPAFRRACLDVLRAGRRLAEDVFVTWPRRLLEIAWVRQFLASPAYRLLQQFVFKPFLTMFLLAILVSIVRLQPIRWPGLLALFVLANLLVNSRVGRRVDEVVTDLAARSWHHFRMRIVMTTFHAVMDFFNEALEAMERVLYAVDEWLRFRSGESQAATVVKATVGFFWYFVNYVIRFCVTLLIEPQINPIKHFPVVTVSHKVLLAQVPLLAAWLAPTFGGEKAALTFVISVIWLIPGVFGFLVWELKENWRLYEANRSPNLKPVLVGSHGETLVRLLRSGFHSGTVPKTFARLRRADRKAQATGSWQGPRKYRDRLHEVRESAERFVDREFVALLDSCPRMRPLGLRLVAVGVGTGHLQFTLAGDGEFAEPLTLTLQEKSFWLTARASLPAWFERLAPEQARALTNAVLGLYKMSGVELVHEQIEACFAPEAPSYELCEEGLRVRPDPNSDAAVLYDLRATAPDAALVSPSTPSTLPTLDRKRLVFSAAPIRWAQWVELWQREDGPAVDADAQDGIEPSWKRALRTTA